MRLKYGFPFLLVALFAQPVDAQELNILFWNIESGGNDPTVIAQELTQLVLDEGPFHLVGLTEVRAGNSDNYAAALGDNFTPILSMTGGGDRMLIIFDEDRFNLIDSDELSEHDGIALNFFTSSGQPRFRSPLFVELEEKNSGQNLLFMVNHLARNNGGDSNGGFREQQAAGLVAWAADQSVLVIMGGDLNLDYNFIDDRGNSSFPIIFGDDDSDDMEYRWIRPVPLVDSNHSGSGTIDTFPNSILDFVTVANLPPSWVVVESEVIVRLGDFPDSGDTSDHRPVQAVLRMDDGGENGEGDKIDREDLLRRLQIIRDELDEIESVLEGEE